MENIDQEVKEMSVKSLESTYRKLSNAYTSMTEKGSNTTLVEKRRNAIKVGLDSLENIWNDKEFLHNEEGIVKSKDILKGLMPSIEKQISKAEEGSPQKTVNERRLIALEFAVHSLDDRM